MSSGLHTLVVKTHPTAPGAGGPSGFGRPAIDLRGALAGLVAGGGLPGDVRPSIGASWRRSVASGLTPDRVDVPFEPDIDSDGLLVRAAGPVLDQLAGDLAGTGVGLVLTDARGHVVDRRVTERLLGVRLDRVLLAPGYVYAEDAVGTNGIGTALAQRSPALVEGEEHFADTLTTVACAAAPITDPRSGRIAGAVDLTCLAAQANPLMLPLVTRAAREIEQRMVDDAVLVERLALQRFLRERRGAKGPFVLLIERRMITNAAADRLVGPDDEPILRDAAGRLHASGDGSDVVKVSLCCGAEVAVHPEPIIDGGTRAGVILRLRPIAHTGADTARSHHRRDVATFGWGSLTDTERSVADLVAQGLTNREAAERLFLSRHTVGFHLRSIFRKLGATSRVQLARLAVEVRSGETLTRHRSTVDAAWS